MLVVGADRGARRSGVIVVNERTVSRPRGLVTESFLLWYAQKRRHPKPFHQGPSPTAKRPGWVELNGDDLRRDPATLASLLVKAGPGIRVNEHLECDGDIVFRHACKMGLEGIVSKRKGSILRSGRSSDWLKMKNPACEAVRRETEEDWGR